MYFNSLGGMSINWLNSSGEHEKRLSCKTKKKYFLLNQIILV